MKKDFLKVLAGIRRIVTSVLSIREGSDIESTVQGIKRDIAFRGPTAWILILAVFIASIGLNVNSTAVIIGAMLISPLMGPILGIGLAVGTNDMETLERSLKNLGIAVSIALITSTLYFLVTPLNIEQTELIARTKPTILDVLVALFGGFAGAIAGSRKEKTNVIPGVAIATALMPPLCTAGYGLATLKMEFFLGAFYLFFINSVFISLSTFIVVKYLRIPVVSFIDEGKLKRYQMMLVTFLIITVTPSVIIFYYVIQETRWKVQAENFVKERCQLEGSELINSRITFSDTVSVIDLYYIGDEIDENEQVQLAGFLDFYKISGSEPFPSTQKTEIRIHQETGNSADFEKMMSDMNTSIRTKVLEDIYTKNEQLIKDKDMKIRLLEQQIMNLSRKDTIPFRQLHKELAFHFKDIDRFSYGKAIEVVRRDSLTVYDTIPTYMLNFKSGIPLARRRQQKEEIEEWLKVRMTDNKIRAIEY